MLQLPCLKNPENSLQSQQGNDEHLGKNLTLRQLWPCVFVPPRAWVSNQSGCHGIYDFITWFQSRAQDRGSRKGLLPAGTPTSKASLQAFCIQYCWSSAAAWETWKGKTNPERKLIHSQASIKHFLLKSYYQTELECSQITSWILKHQVN